MENCGAENHGAEPAGNQKSRSDRDAVEERVDGQAGERRVGHARIHKLIAVRLFTKMEMGGPGMFKVVNNEVSQKDQRGTGLGSKAQAFRNHLRQRRGQHEARAQSDEEGEKRAAPRPRGNNGAAKQVGNPATIPSARLIQR